MFSAGSGPAQGNAYNSLVSDPENHETQIEIQQAFALRVARAAGHASGTGPFGSVLTNRIGPFDVAAGVIGPVSPKATATAFFPFVPFPGVNVGIGLQAQAAATANTFLAGIPNSANAPNSTIIGPPNPFTNLSPGLASPFEIGPASPVTSAVIPTTNTLSPLVNAVSSLTSTLNAITGNSNTSSGLGNTFNTATNTLNVLTNTLNALVNATLFSDISGFLGSATTIVQVNPGISTERNAYRPGQLGHSHGRIAFRPGQLGHSHKRNAFRPGQRRLSHKRNAFRPGKLGRFHGCNAFRPGKLGC